MLTLTVLKPKGMFSFDFDVVNQKGLKVYRYRSNWLMTKHWLIDLNGQILFESRSSLTWFNWPVKHSIMSKGEVVYTLEPKFRNNGPEDHTWMVGHTETKNFSIYTDQREALRVTNYQRENEAFAIEVDETKADFMIMLMMSVIVMYFEVPIY